MIRAGAGEGRFVPPPYEPPPGEEESLDVWGFRDTRFELRPDGVVELLGDRYPLCGEQMEDVLGWVRETFHPAMAPDDRNEPHYPPAIPPARRHRAFENEICKHLATDQIDADPEQRLRHGHGHTQRQPAIQTHARCIGITSPTGSEHRDTAEDRQPDQNAK